MRVLALIAAIGVVGCSSGGGGGPTGGGGSTGAGGSMGAGGTGTGGMGTGGQFTGSSGCALFTSDDVWNADVSGRTVDATNTTRMYNLIGSTTMIHPDFGPGFGIPINTVPANQMPLPITFDNYP